MGKTPKQAGITVDSLMTEGLEGLRAYIRDAREMLQANPSDSDRAATLATVLMKVASVQGEQRRSEIAQRKADDDMSPERILDRIRRMPARDRRQLLAQMQSIDADAGRSGLA